MDSPIIPSSPSEKPLTDETNVTDIELMPDGRIFVFGTSMEVLEVLNQLRTRDDDEIDARIENAQSSAVNRASTTPSQTAIKATSS